LDRNVRRLISVPCEGETLAATLDEAAGDIGLLIVSGGNEVRSGAHRGMAMLAQRLAAADIPVFRYDRRGVGDSSGENGGFLSAEADLTAATAAFRVAAPGVARIAGFGNCDAATTLALFGRDAGVDSIILANPWIVEKSDDLPPAAAIRARYAQRLRDPESWLRLVRGGVQIGKLISGLKKLFSTKFKTANALGVRVTSAIDRWQDGATIILASGDATAQAFAAEYRGPLPTIRLDTASHSFAGAGNAARLEAEIVAALHRM
jgi:exosortase A-associated hydrolase 1